ncbi:hypothetical protein S245_048101, partial [Arachis hypogaea]
QWWESYGTGAPNLQKLAIHVLSQICSSSGCERNWSIFEHIHTKKRNRNLMKKQSYDPICLDAFDDHSDWILEDSRPFLTPKEVDALRNDLVNMSIQPTLDNL